MNGVHSCIDFESECSGVVVTRALLRSPFSPPPCTVRSTRLHTSRHAIVNMEAGCGAGEDDDQESEYAC